MIERAFASLPPARPPLRLTVAIPARDEEALLPRQLAALADQRTDDGRQLPRGTFDVVVFANGCRDATAEVARAARARGLAVYVVEADLPPETAHVGAARKAVMDAAARRFRAAGLLAGLIASTDADSVVDPTWVAHSLLDAAGVEAVAGRIEPLESDVRALPPSVRAAYANDVAYWQALADVEALRDPVPWDPAPRHGQHFGASFCVRADAYDRAGGVPLVAYLEDVALYRSLVRVDARVRHSRRVSVRTSGRSASRVAGGFATFLGDLRDGAANGNVPLAEFPAVTLARIDARAALRRCWSGAGTACDVARAGSRFGVDAGAVAALVDRSLPFGAVHERYDAAIAEAVAAVAPVPLAEALAALRTACVRPPLAAARS